MKYFLTIISICLASFGFAQWMPTGKVQTFRCLIVRENRIDSGYVIARKIKYFPPDPNSIDANIPRPRHWESVPGGILDINHKPVDQKGIITIVAKVPNSDIFIYN